MANTFCPCLNWIKLWWVDSYFYINPNWIDCWINSHFKGTISYLFDFMIVNGLNVLNHKHLLREDLKEECNLDIPVEKYLYKLSRWFISKSNHCALRIRLRKKISKRPGLILLDNQIFGSDLYVNLTNELCIEILDGKSNDFRNKCSPVSDECKFILKRAWKKDTQQIADTCLFTALEGRWVWTGRTAGSYSERQHFRDSYRTGLLFNNHQLLIILDSPMFW